MDRIYQNLITELKRNSIESIYARYHYLLMVAADENGEKYEELYETVKILENMIATRYMKQNGWYYNEEETYPKWIKIE